MKWLYNEWPMDVKHTQWKVNGSGMITHSNHLLPACAGLNKVCFTNDDEIHKPDFISPRRAHFKTQLILLLLVISIKGCGFCNCTVTWLDTEQNKTENKWNIFWYVQSMNKEKVKTAGQFILFTENSEVIFPPPSFTVLLRAFGHKMLAVKREQRNI